MPLVGTTDANKMIVHPEELFTISKVHLCQQDTHSQVLDDYSGFKALLFFSLGLAFRQ